MADSVDPDQTAPSGVVWSGSALFAYVILSDIVFEILGPLPYYIIFTQHIGSAMFVQAFLPKIW